MSPYLVFCILILFVSKSALSPPCGPQGMMPKNVGKPLHCTVHMAERRSVYNLFIYEAFLGLWYRRDRGCILHCFKLTPINIVPSVLLGGETSLPMGSPAWYTATNWLPLWVSLYFCLVIRQWFFAVFYMYRDSRQVMWGGGGQVLGVMEIRDVVKCSIPIRRCSVVQCGRMGARLTVLRGISMQQRPNLFTCDEL